jgi:hypothetical protein
MEQAPSLDAVQKPLQTNICLQTALRGALTHTWLALMSSSQSLPPIVSYQSVLTFKKDSCILKQFKFVKELQELYKGLCALHLDSIQVLPVVCLLWEVQFMTT